MVGVTHYCCNYVQHGCSSVLVHMTSTLGIVCCDGTTVVIYVRMYSMTVRSVLVHGAWMTRTLAIVCCGTTVHMYSMTVLSVLVHGVWMTRTLTVVPLVIYVRMYYIVCWYMVCGLLRTTAVIYVHNCM